MAEYTPVIYSSNSLPCAPKKEEFLHFIFVLTYAEVHGGLDPNHRWVDHEVAMKSSKSSEKIMMLLLKSNDSTYFLGEVAVMLTFGRVVAITS